MLAEKSLADTRMDGPIWKWGQLEKEEPLSVVIVGFIKVEVNL